MHLQSHGVMAVSLRLGTWKEAAIVNECKTDSHQCKWSGRTILSNIFDSPLVQGASRDVVNRLRLNTLSDQGTCPKWRSSKKRTILSNIVCWGDPKCGGRMETVPAEGDVDIISTYGSFAALTKNGEVRSWEASSLPEQPCLKIPPNVETIRATSGAFAALHKDGMVTTWGNPAVGRNISLVHNELKAIQWITANSTIFFAGRADHVIVYWGFHTGILYLCCYSAGELGHPKEYTRPDSQKVWGLDASVVCAPPRLGWLNQADGGRHTAGCYCGANVRITISAVYGKGVNSLPPSDTPMMARGAQLQPEPDPWYGHCSGRDTEGCAKSTWSLAAWFAFGGPLFGVLPLISMIPFSVTVLTLI